MPFLSIHFVRCEQNLDSTGGKRHDKYRSDRGKDRDKDKGDRGGWREMRSNRYKTEDMRIHIDKHMYIYVTA